MKINKPIIFVSILVCLTGSKAFASCHNGSDQTSWPNSTYTTLGNITHNGQPSGFKYYSYDSCQNVAYASPYYWTGCTTSVSDSAQFMDAYILTADDLTCTNSPASIN